MSPLLLHFPFWVDLCTSAGSTSLHQSGGWMLMMQCLNGEELCCHGNQDVMKRLCCPAIGLCGKVASLDSTGRD